MDLETKEAENLLNVDTKQAEHQTAVDELTKNIEDMTSSKTELVEQRDLLEKQLDSELLYKIASCRRTSLLVENHVLFDYIHQSQHLS